MRRTSLRANSASRPASKCFLFPRTTPKDLLRWSRRSRERCIRWTNGMSQLNYKESTVARARRVVIKVGSAVLSEAGGLRLDVIERLANEIEAAVKGGREIV